MEHDKGWYAHEITLITHPIDGHRRRLTLPCRWIEYVQNWDAKGTGRPFFQISASHTAGLMTEKWHILTFLDGAGNLAQSFLVKALASSELRLRLLATIWGFGGAVPRPLR
ncbi:hypothetical protein [Acidisoma sp. L85]|uniref:hypothetical protein n=1 Tax=Acidisoma sp. L85 TaxID=1641850 RepID=UPI00131DA081|nr:hypothetical protein [Acidisoma sp. L85]